MAAMSMRVLLQAWVMSFCCLAPRVWCSEPETLPDRALMAQEAQSLVELLLDDRDRYLTLLDRLIPYPAHNHFTLYLLEEGRSFLSLKQLYKMLATSRQADNIDLTKILQKVVVTASLEQAEVFDWAIVEAFAQQDGGLVIDLWFAAGPRLQTLDRYLSILDYAAETANEHVLLTLAQTYPSTEGNFQVSPRVKSFILAKLASAEAAEDVVRAYVKQIRLDEQIPMGFDRSFQVRVTRTALDNFIVQANKFPYSRADLKALTAYIKDAIVTRRLTDLSHDSLLAQCEAWQARIVRYGVPPSFVTRH